GQHERDRGAVPSSSPGTPGSVDVALVLVGWIEVDHLRDVVEVEPACGDVGGDERLDLAALEACESSLTRVLGHISVHPDGLHVLSPEPLHEPVRSSLRAGEHERETV